MINTDMSNPKAYYSPYGYVEVEYLDYNDRDNEMIRFRNREHRLCGTIRVNKYYKLENKFNRSFSYSF